MKLKKIITVLALALVSLLLWKPVNASAQDVPASVTAYVGDILDLESKYGIYPDGSSDYNIYDCYTGECCRKGKAEVTYYDDDYEEQTITVNVVYNKNIRMVADCWYTSGSGRYFTLKLKNIAAKNLVVYSAGATYVDKNKKSRNRNLKLANGKSSVTIKPGKMQTIKFKCKKNRLNFYMDASYFKFKCKYNGKKYTIKIVLKDEHVNAYKLVGKKWVFIDTNCEDW